MSAQVYLESHLKLKINILSCIAMLVRSSVFVQLVYMQRIKMNFEDAWAELECETEYITYNYISLKIQQNC